MVAPLNRTRLEIASGLWIDARRAAWLSDPRILVVADLHLGYAWAHRHAGQLFPVATGEDTLPRLRALIDEYEPRELILLGDIVHAAAPVPALLDGIRALVQEFAARTILRAVLGNHDRHLAALLRDAAIDLPLLTTHRVPPHHLLHGDADDQATAERHLSAVGRAGGRIIMGHEHPVISLSDGIASHLRVPCFLVAPELLILPAFSPWAAGANVRAGEFLSAYARAVTFQQAVALLAGKLLPLPMPRRTGNTRGLNQPSR